MIIVIAGGGADNLMPYHLALLKQLEEEMCMNPYYGHNETFGSDWRTEKRIEHEEKLKMAQTYKRKYQNHPAYRK